MQEYFQNLKSRLDSSALKPFWRAKFRVLGLETSSPSLIIYEPESFIAGHVLYLTNLAKFEN